MSKIVTIKDVLAEMADKRGNPQLVRNWKDLLPPGSNWHPGDPGDPACKECNGTGYLRLEGLPVGHKYFGKIIFCECAAEKVRQWEARHMQDSDADRLRSMPSYLK
jgi:hypothetical protein